MSEHQIVSIAKLSPQGEGIAYLNGAEIYVPQALVGEKLKISVGEPFVVGSKRRPGSIVEVLDASSEREDQVLCPWFGECGGCQFMHLKYEQQLKTKAQAIYQAADNVVQKVLQSGQSQISLEDLNISYVVGMEQNRGQICRFKSIRYIAQDATGHLQSGFFAPRSHNLVPVQECVVEPAIFGKIAQNLTLVLDEAGCVAFTAPAPVAETKSKSAKSRAKADVTSSSAKVVPTGTTTVATSSDGATLSADSIPVRALVMRQGDQEQLLVCLLVAAPLSESLRARLKSFAAEHHISSFYVGLNANAGNALFTNDLELIYGEPFITKTILGQQYQVGPNTFLQVNYEMCEKLYAAAIGFCVTGQTQLTTTIPAAWAKPELAEDVAEGSGSMPGAEGIALDLCCGVGTMTLALARHFKHVIGVEIVEDSITAAKANAQLNHFTSEQVHFIAGDLYKVLPSVIKPYKQQAVRAVIADPSRVGIGEENTRLLSKLKGPCRISLVYCALAALQRELPVFIKQGFKVELIQGFDMFPHSSHIETLVCLSKA